LAFFSAFSYISYVTYFVILSLSFFSASGSNLVCAAVVGKLALDGGSNFFYEAVFFAGYFETGDFFSAAFGLGAIYTEAEPCEAVSKAPSSPPSSSSILIFEKADSPVAAPPLSFLSSFSR